MCSINRWVQTISCKFVPFLQQSKAVCSSRAVVCTTTTIYINLHVFLQLMESVWRTTQRTNSGQIPACSQEPVDSTDANMVETSTCLETTQQEMTNFTVRYRSNRTGPCSAAPLSVQSSYRYQNILRIGEVLGHRIDAKISPKPASEKAQTTVSENTYTFPNIDVFRTAILSLLAPTGNNARASFLVHQVPRTSATVLWYRRMFTQFSLRVWVSEYTVVRWLLTYSTI